MSEGTADRQLRDRAGAVIPGGMYGHQAAPGAAYPQFMRGGRGAGLGRGRERVRRPDVQLRPGRARPPAPGRRGGRRGTGFRLHLGSSWEPVGVDPDLSAWSKAIANSRALAAVVGYGLMLAALWYFGGLLWRLKKGTAGVKPVEDLAEPPPSD